MNLQLDGKTVFVSASTQGIGKAIAVAFLQEGAGVVINGRDGEHLRRVHAELSPSFGDRVDSFLGDMCDEEKIAQLKTHLAEHHGRVDILVANLGSGKAEDVDPLSASEWQRFYTINTLSAVRLIHAVFPLMKQQKGGSIVVISSIAGVERTRAPYGYAAAKGALLTLVQNLSVELAGFGVRVNVVAPGNVYVPGGRWEEIISRHPEIIETYIEREVPLRRFGTPEEVAAAVVFLGSPVSAFTTGACLIVDGGETRGY